MALLIDEGFEAVGYEEVWTPATDAGCTLDPNLNTPIPIPEGIQCLECYVVDESENQANIRQDKTSQPILYAGFYLYIDVLPTAGLYHTACYIQGTAFGLVCRIEIKNNGGLLQARYQYYDNSALASTAWVTFTVQTWTLFEFQYDETNSLWEWKIDGVSQHNGALSGVTRTPRYIFFGIKDNLDTVATTTYLDLVRIDNATWTHPVVGGVVPQIQLLRNMGIGA